MGAVGGSGAGTAADRPVGQLAPEFSKRANQPVGRPHSVYNAQFAWMERACFPFLTLWSANKGVKALIDAIAIACGDDLQRGFVAKNALSLGLTVAAVLALVIAIALIIGLPVALEIIGRDAGVGNFLSLARWPILAIVILAALAAIYRVSPPRAHPKWRWVTPGAAVSTTLGIAASIAFSYYTANFDSYNKTYSSVAAVAILLMWFFISAFIVLIGAEINCVCEKQTARETTTGSPQPLGSPNAVAADTVVRPKPY